MGDEKSTILMASRERERERDRELLIPVADSGDEVGSSKPSSSSPRHTGREVSLSDLLFKYLITLILFALVVMITNFVSIAKYFRNFVDDFTVAEHFLLK